MTTPVDPGRCPLCGEANECAMVNGATTCWCFEVTIPPAVLEKVPAEAKGVACVCRVCASGRRNLAKTAEQLNELLRRR